MIFDRSILNGGLRLLTSELQPNTDSFSPITHIYQQVIVLVVFSVHLDLSTKQGARYYDLQIKCLEEEINSMQNEITH